jgi:hypothetical protein
VVQSRLKAGEIIAQVDLPTRSRPQRTQLRLRVPDDWRVIGAEVDGKTLAVDERGTVDLTAFTGSLTVRGRVVRR